MKLSKFGKKFTRDAGIISLMDDLGNALASREDLIMMGEPRFYTGSGAAFQKRIATMATDPELIRRSTCIYDPPQGS